MEVIICEDSAQIGTIAAAAIEALLTRKPAAVLGLATGSSPLAIYDELATRCAAGEITFGRARGFTLDEYVGLPADHPERYRNVIDTVALKGEGFTPHVAEGDTVTAGQPVITYDVPSVVAAGLNPIVPVVVMDEREPANVVPGDAVGSGAELGTGATLFIANR